MARKPVISLAPFVEAHEDLDKAIWRYHVSAAGKNKLPPDLLTKFLKQNASDDFAINLHTRIAYAKSADHFIRRRLRLNELGSVFFVDIVCKKHVTSLSDAEPFNLGKLKKWMAKRLKGMNYFGALDAAYYYNGANITGKEGPAIFWHGHFMVWGVSEEEIEVRQTMVNERFEAGFPQAKCLYYKNWTENIEGRALYIMKAPQSGYTLSLYADSVETVDLETGEVEQYEVEKANQFKGKIKQSGFANVAKAYSVVTMADILTASGDGNYLLRDIVEGAHERLSQDRTQQQAAKAEMIGLPKQVWPASARNREIVVSPVRRLS